MYKRSVKLNKIFILVDPIAHCSWFYSELRNYQIIDKLLSCGCLKNTKEWRERNETIDLENNKSMDI